MSERNPEPGEIRQTEQEPDRAMMFRCVLLDIFSSSLGVWSDAAESVKLYLCLSNEYVEPRIEIKMTIKWHDGKISHENRPGEQIFRLVNTQIDSVEALRIVKIPTDGPPLPFVDTILQNTADEELEVFSELYNIGLEQTKVDELVSMEQLWVLAISLQPDKPRFGPGIFNQVRTYGDQTTTVHKIRDKFHDDVDLYFVVRANDLQGAVQEFLEACMKLPEIPLAQFFPKNPKHPFLQQGGVASTKNMSNVTAEVNYAFPDWYYYNTFVGYGTIMEHENELKRVRNGKLFEAEIQVFAVSKGDSNTYMACLRLPNEIQHLRMGSSVQIHWQAQSMRAMMKANDQTTEEWSDHTQDRIRLGELEILDRWTGEVIEPLPAARKHTISLIIRRPSKETPGARQPTIVSNLKNSAFENVMVRIPVSNKTYKRFLTCNHDLQHWSKAEVARELLGGDLMELPRVDLLQGVDKDLIQATITRGRVNPDIKNIIEGLPNGRGRFFTITGPAGSGKSYVLYVLSLLILKSSNFLYPVHPDGAKGSWMPNFQNHKRGSRDVEEEPEKQKHKPQVVISCPTNSLTSANCVKMQRAADRLFAGEPIMIIRIHPLELELLIADQSYTRQEQHSRVTEGHDQQAEEDFSEEGLVKVLKTVLEHYRKSLPSVGSTMPSIKDSRLELMEHSLGHRMLQVCGIIPGSPWVVSGKYRDFVRLHARRLEQMDGLIEEQELAFNKDMKRLARDTMARADIVFGTPFVLGTSLMYHSLHPTVVFIDEAGMSAESDLLPIITYYFPNAFGLFGDPKQLGPTIISSKEDNPFGAQLSVPLLSRMMINGCQTFNLAHQHRLVGTIHHFTNRLFYERRTLWQKSKDLDPEGWESKIKTFNMRRYRVNSNMVFLNVQDSQEMAVGTSWANRANVITGLDIVYDLVCEYSILPEDIVVLVGYDAQKRQYLSEISRRVDSVPEVNWLDVRINVIETFQGNEAKFAIFDFVRSETMGHMRSSRRLNAGMTRARFGLWCLYNVNSMIKHVDSKCWILREMQGLLKAHEIGATVKLPEMDCFPKEEEDEPTQEGAPKKTDGRQAQRMRMREA